MLKTELDFSISLFREGLFFVFEEKLTTFAELEKVFI
jgi:hypothetical protein